MWITTDQATEIYARFCRARYGGHAIKVISERAAELRKRGDTKGEQVWTEVGQKIERGDFTKMHSAA